MPRGIATTAFDANQAGAGARNPCRGRSGRLRCDRPRDHTGSHYDRATDAWWSYDRASAVHVFPRHGD